MKLDGLVFITSNPGKAREVARFLGREVRAVPLDLPEIQDVRFDVVARRKALDAAKAAGTPVLVEDSGLEVAAWNGFPGALTKWITVHSSQETLAHMLDGFADRRAEAVSALAIAGPDDEESDVLVVEGRVKGSLAKEPRGANGFGWDVLFIPDGDTRTFAEMELGEKDAISHRFRAFEALRRALAAQEA